MRPVYVAVCGGSSVGAQEADWAEAVGRLLAEEGAVVITGGLGGVMAAAAKGVAVREGTAIAILPTEHHDDASPDHTFVIPTGLGEARNTLIVRASDVVIAVGGEFGTLSEIALALRMGVPVVGLQTWELQRAGLEIPILRAENPVDAVRLALEAARAKRDTQS